MRVGELEVFKDKPVKKHQRIFEQNSQRVYDQNERGRGRERESEGGRETGLSEMAR